MSSLKKPSVFIFVAIAILFTVGFIVSTEVSVAKPTIFITSTPQSTRIPLPNAPESINQVEFLTLDESCRLPCFWGFRPGYTTAHEILAFVQSNVDYSKIEGGYEIPYYFPDEDPIISIIFSVDDELLSSLEVIIDNPVGWLPSGSLELPNLLAQMQMTSSQDIYLSVNTGQRRIFLTLVYDDAGMVFQYPFDLKVRGNVVSPNVDEPLLLCSQLELNDFIRFWIQDGDGQELLVEHIIGFQADAKSNHNWPVEQMTGINNEAFDKEIIDHPDECVEMLSYPELLGQGYEF